MNLHDPDIAGHNAPSTAERFAELIAAQQAYDAKESSRMTWEEACRRDGWPIAEDVEPEPHGLLTVICGALAVVLLAMAFFNIPLWSN